MALGVIINFSSKGDVPSKTAVVVFYLSLLCFRLDVFQDICFKNGLVEYDEKESLWCKSTAITVYAYDLSILTAQNVNCMHESKG